jgi:glucose dehydrogenase
VAGALTAYKLAKAGFQVRILEAGPEVNRSQAVANFAKTLDPAQTYPHSLGDQPRWGSDNAYYQQVGPETFGGLYERAVGGTTWHWIGSCLRFLESDFELYKRYGVGADWPIELNELKRFYTEAESELGVSGSAAMPALSSSFLDQQVAKAALKYRLKVEVFPAARNSQSYQGRPACQGHASCFPICPIGAKYDASIHIKLAQQAGATLMYNTRARRLLSSRGRVTGLEIDGPNGPLRMDADAYILAANAVESPRLLLFSQLDRFPTGRFLMGMSGQISWALAPEPVWPYRSPQVISGITQFRDGPWRKDRAASLLSIGNDGWPGHSPPELAQRYIQQGFIGAALVEKIRHHASRQLLLVTNCEELGRAENRISLSDNMDSSGVPKPSVRFQLGEYTRAAIDHSVLIHARIFDSMQATEVHHVEESTDPAHIAGTCRMGNDPKQSVVNSNLRHHDLDNLYVVGSSVFPTVGSAPPTLTIAALALRLAHSLAKTRSC